MAASPEYISHFGEPKTIDELLLHQSILDTNHPRYDSWLFVKDGGMVNAPLQGSLILSQANAVIDAACAGIGIACIPDLFVHSELEQGKLVQILKDTPCQKYSLNTLFPDREFIPQKTRVFIDFLVELFAE